MTAAAWPAIEDRPSLGARLAAGPREGWSSVVLLATMLLAVAMAVDDGRWAGETAWQASETAFLLPAIMLGAAWGLVAGLSRLHWLVAHLIGALCGGLFLIVAVAGVVSPAASLGVRLDALMVSVVLFARDLFVLGIRSSQTSVFLLVLGAFGWALGQYAAFVTYRRARPLNAVMASGLFLLVELSATLKDEYRFLILFAVAALLFLVRMHLAEQQNGWFRRRIGDVGSVSSLYMRSGTLFVGLAVAGALILTATASSAPLFGWWRGFDSTLLDWGQRLNLVVGGVSSSARGPSDLFSSTATISGFWQSSEEPAFSYSPGAAGPQYWLGATYSTFDGRSWHQASRTASAVVAAGGQVLARTRDFVGPGPGLDDVRITVTDEGIDAPTLLTPEMPTTVDRITTVYTDGQDGPFAGAEFVDAPRPGQTYTVHALVHAAVSSEGAVTEAELAAASQTYPAWLEPYVQYKGAVGQTTIETTARIVDALPETQRDAFHITKAVQDYLYAGGGFTYNTDVRDLCPAGDLVDCFLQVKQGYCEYFASAMTMMLRTQGIPARYVRGYLPGQPTQGGAYEVSRGAAHAWVEVYFPGYGWIRFDPTPGNAENGQRPTVLDPGVPATGPGGSDAPGIQPGRRTFEPAESAATPGPTAVAAVAGGSGSGSGPAGPLIIGLLVLLLVVAVATSLLGRWQRGPAVAEPEAVYRGMARLAGRFGYGPRPTQTAYEYASSLAELLPGARPELEVVARAKVETSYAHRPPQGSAMAALREAYGRLRVRLLRLALRRRR
ncbi:MAG TPA: DUF3488 and transglutaminase-like domain-containing protein [Candidatus Limnocylindrales bacterium]|nr:DUF3488 and transglutaminase-like domain-containing protein [Candidatus Limnocylindrales bacterium]